MTIIQPTGMKMATKNTAVERPGPGYCSTDFNTHMHNNFRTSRNKN